MSLPPQPLGQPSPQQPPQPQQPSPGPPAAKPPKQKRFGWVALSIASVIGLGIGGTIGGASSSDVTAQPAPTMTVTEAASGSEPTAEPGDEPTEPTSGTYVPKKSDFKLVLRQTSKQCYGSAGCNVEFKIKPYVVDRSRLPKTGEVEVSYKVTGAEDPFEDSVTFYLDDDQVDEIWEESVSTRSRSSKLKVVITDVEYTE